MVTAPNKTSLEIARRVRGQFVAQVGTMVGQLAPLIRARMQLQVDESTNAKVMQDRRDAWLEFQKQESAWMRGCSKGLQSALQGALPMGRVAPNGEQNFELLGDEVIESQILASRFALRLLDKVSWELNDLRLRVQSLEARSDLAAGDVLRPETLARIVVEQWVRVGLSREAWTGVQDIVQNHLTDRLVEAYHAANESLVAQGVMADIDLRPLVKRTADASGAAAKPVASKNQSGGSGANGTGGSGSGGRGSSSGGGSGGTGGHAGFFGGGGRGAFFAAPQAASVGAGRGGTGYSGGGDGAQSQAMSGANPNGAGSANGRAAGNPTDLHEETRMLTNTTPLARVRMRAQGVMGQLKRLLSDKISGYDDTRTQNASAPLAKALAVQMEATEHASVLDSIDGPYEAVHVEQAVGLVRERSAQLKKAASTSGEKATIEIVALMFQSILAEERISAAVRVWFARLQMPVLRVALSEPEFFGSLQHPARRLIDRMGSCVLGFEAAVSGSAMESEIKRVVQVIEQYPETGRRVFQLVYDEFQKFLGKFLTEQDSAQRIVSVAQQVEQKETMAIQYTIELRNMLGNLPVRDEIRNFLFKVWAEILAIAAVKSGPQHADTLQLKQVATDLVWAASAKPNRQERSRVIQDLPKLLQRLRMGMSLLGLPEPVQDQHIKSISDTLADAFMSKTEAIDPERIQEMARRIVNLEDFLSDEDVGDLPLDAENIQLMLGIDTTDITIIAEGGSEPTEAMRAWATELQQGAWFSLDHNGRVDRVQFAWRSDRGQLYMFASTDKRTYLFQSRRLAGYLQAGLLTPMEDEALTVRATREALAKLDANPERLLS